MDIPILIICFNNHRYVDNTIRQLERINKEYMKNIIIIDNCSTDKDTIDYLQKVHVNVYKNIHNIGPWVDIYRNVHIYAGLPNKYIITDPDLEFNSEMPSDYIEQLSQLSDTYKCAKLGLALDISEPSKFFDTTKYTNNKSINEWESSFWEIPIEDPKYKLYKANTDTTFCLFNKEYYEIEQRGGGNSQLRIAGKFTAKHLPWYKENPLFNPYDNYKKNGFVVHHSSISNIIKEYTLKMYHIIPKNNEFHLIKKDDADPNIHVWKNIYSRWEQDTFEDFDRILHKDKVCIDIGGWIGTTSIYSSRMSKHVYVIEADRSSYYDLLRNCAINSTNITCINKAIYNIDNTDIYFGKNKFIENSKENDSTSQIYSTNDSIDNDCYIVKTITLASLCKEYNINTQEVSLVKVDIEGGEENILEDLFQFHTTTQTPLYISFHYSWWNDKNLSRFPFLTETHKEHILQNPFVSILFS